MQIIYNALPNSFDVVMNYANILRFSTQFDKALTFIKKLKSIKSNTIIPHYMKIRVLAESGEKDKASKKLVKMQNNYRIEDHTLLEIRFMSYGLLSLSNREYAHKVITTYLTMVPGDLRALSHCIYINLLQENFKFVIKKSKEYLKTHPCISKCRHSSKCALMQQLYTCHNV